MKAAEAARLAAAAIRPTTAGDVYCPVDASTLARIERPTHVPVDVPVTRSPWLPPLQHPEDVVTLFASAGELRAEVFESFGATPCTRWLLLACPFAVPACVAGMGPLPPAPSSPLQYSNPAAMSLAPCRHHGGSKGRCHIPSTVPAVASGLLWLEPSHAAGNHGSDVTAPPWPCSRHRSVAELRGRCGSRVVGGSVGCGVVGHGSWVMGWGLAATWEVRWRGCQHPHVLQGRHPSAHGSPLTRPNIPAHPRTHPPPPLQPP